MDGDGGKGMSEDNEGGVEVGIKYCRGRGLTEKWGGGGMRTEGVERAMEGERGWREGMREGYEGR